MRELSRPSRDRKGAGRQQTLADARGSERIGGRGTQLHLAPPPGAVGSDKTQPTHQLDSDRCGNAPCVRAPDPLQPDEKAAPVVGGADLHAAGRPAGCLHHDRSGFITPSQLGVQSSALHLSPCKTEFCTPDYRRWMVKQKPQVQRAVKLLGVPRTRRGRRGKPSLLAGRKFQQEIALGADVDHAPAERFAGGNDAEGPADIGAPLPPGRE